MQRTGMVLRLHAHKVEAYKELHRAVWPEILALLSRHGITNYSIYLKEPENLLFGYWEYGGTDYAADMKALSDDPANKAWWEVCVPCQLPLEHRQPGEWWATMDEVFHLD